VCIEQSIAVDFNVSVAWWYDDDYNWVANTTGSSYSSYNSMPATQQNNKVNTSTLMMCVY